MQRIHILFFSIITLLFFLFPTHICAGITGKVTGQILDARTNEPLIGVNVIVDGTHYGAATGQTGRYVLLNIPPGTYTLIIRMMGYQTKVVNNVNVSSDYTTTINAKLKTEVIAGEQVTVTAERPLI